MRTRTATRVAHVLGVSQAVAITVMVLVVGWELATLAVGLAVTVAVGWLLAARVPHNPLGWLLLAFSGFFVLAGVAFGAALLIEERWPGAAAWLFWYAGNEDSGWAWLPSVGLLFTQVPLRFPDGQLPSPRWRWFSAISLVLLGALLVVLMTAGPTVHPGLANPVYVPWVGEHVDAVFVALGLPVLACFAVSAASLAVRYRRAGDVQRHQIRWVAWAAAVVVVLFILSFVVSSDGYDQAFTVAYAVVPAAIGVAVLRYRLYDIDRILSRTVSYALVSAAVLGVYAVVVTSVTRLLPVSSTFAVAGATLAAAAAARPALTRVRRAVDRRFDRAGYDARLVVERFGASLRESVDTEDTMQRLLGAVDDALAPSRVGVWRRP